MTNKQIELPPLVFDSKAPAAKADAEYKGVFHEHKILIIFCAIIIFVAIVIVLVYYFSKRDLALPKKVDPRMLQERKLEEKKMDTEEVQEREKIKKINEARRRLAAEQAATQAGQPRRAAQHAVRPEQQFEMEHAERSGTQVETKNSDRDTRDIRDIQSSSAQPSKPSKVPDSVNIADLVGQPGTRMEVDVENTVRPDMVETVKPAGSSPATSLEEHQKQNILGQ